jgi:hypothetical protein
MKSIFIGTFIGLLSISLLHACIAVDLRGLAIGWLGVVASSVSNLAFLYWLDARDTAQSRTHFRLLLLLTALGALISLWGATRAVPVIDRLPPWYSVTVLVGTALYVFWYVRTGEAERSQMPSGLNYRFLAGRDVADANMVRHAGNGSQMLVIRSNLCPYCVAAQVLFLDDDGDHATRHGLQSHGELPLAGRPDGAAGADRHEG